MVLECQVDGARGQVCCVRGQVDGARGKVGSVIGYVIPSKQP